MGLNSKSRNWGAPQFDELLAGMGEPGMLREVDKRGMTPTIAAALEAGSATNRLMSLLDGPGAGEGESALERIEELLTEQVALQRAVVEKIDALIRLMSPRAARKADQAELARREALAEQEPQSPPDFAPPSPPRARKSRTASAPTD